MKNDEIRMKFSRVRIEYKSYILMAGDVGIRKEIKITKNG